MSRLPKKAPKVSYILVWFPKASETFVFREICELRQHGLDVEVFTLYGPLRKDLNTAMATYGGPVTRLGLRSIPCIVRDMFYWLGREPASWLRSVGLLFRRWRSWETAGEAVLSVCCGMRFARLFIRKGVTHIHADWANGPATAAWVASKLTGIPFTFTGRAGDIFPPDGALVEKARDCYAIRTDVARNVPYLVERAQVPPHKVRLIYAALALSVERPAAPQLGTPCILAAVGRFVPKKGFDVLLRAVGHLRERGRDVRLLLAGSGPLERELKKLCRELGIEEAVEFAGFVPHDRVPDLLRRSDCFVMSSRVSATGDRDGIPNVVLEAMAHGLPVVGTDVSGIGEVVQDGQTGVLVPPQDYVALAKGVERMLDAPEQALAMARNARRMVLRRFDPARTAQELMRLYTRDASAHCSTKE